MWVSPTEGLVPAPSHASNIRQAAKLEQEEDGKQTGSLWVRDATWNIQDLWGMLALAGDFKLWPREMFTHPALTPVRKLCFISWRPQKSKQTAQLIPRVQCNIFFGNYYQKQPQLLYIIFLLNGPLKGWFLCSVTPYLAMAFITFLVVLLLLEHRMLPCRPLEDT